MAEEYTTDSIRRRKNYSDKPVQKEGAVDNIIGQKESDSYFKYIKSQLKTVIRNQRVIQKQQRKQPFYQLPRRSNIFIENLHNTTLPESGVDECIHGDVIQLNMKAFVEEVDLSDGRLIDEMFENGLLSEIEKREIQELSIIDKTRKLAIILARNDKSKFKKFLQIISKPDFYPHIGQLLSDSYEKRLRENEERIECVRCFILLRVDIKQIMDHLCEKRFIDLKDVDNIIEGNKTFLHELWEKIFQRILDQVSGGTHLKIFKAALQEHYPHIAKKIYDQNSLKCLCPSLSHTTGSVRNTSEISSTSTETCKWVQKLDQRPTDYQTNHSTQIMINTGEPKFRYNDQKGAIRAKKVNVGKNIPKYERLQSHNREKEYQSSKEYRLRSPSPLSTDSSEESNIMKCTSKCSPHSEEEEESIEEREFKSSSLLSATKNERIKLHVPIQFRRQSRLRLFRKWKRRETRETYTLTFPPSLSPSKLKA